MAEVDFTPNLRRHLRLERCTVDGATVAEVIAALSARQPALRGYLLDDQDGLRQHVNVFIDGTLLRDRRHLRDVVGMHSRIYIVQALSGG